MENDKQKLLDFLNKSITDAEDNLKMIRLTVDFSEFSNQLKVETPLTKSSVIFSFNSLITIGKLETAIQLKSILTVESEWEQKYFLRLACLTVKTVLETSDTYYKKLTDFTSEYPTLLSFWQDLNTEVLSFKTSFYIENKVEEIVNTTVTNINPDFKNYYDTITEIDIENAQKMLFEFIILLEKLFLFSCECLEVDMDKNIDIDEVKSKLLELSLRIESIRNAYKNLN